MAKLVVCQGLPGSGKSYWASQQLNATVVCKDDIRAELEAKGWVWSRENEKDVIKAQETRIKAAAELGDQLIIVADTNFGRHPVRLRQLADRLGLEFEIKDFTDVPVEICIERDALREGKACVGRQVIINMAKQYLDYKEPVPEFAPYVADPTLPKAVICDLDGTLSLFKEKGHRGPYDASNCDEDEVNEPVLACLNAMRKAGYKIIFMSGREDVYRPQTLKFLERIYYNRQDLYMRKTNDTRKDWIVKGEMFDANIRGKYNVIFCLDDRDQVVEFYRSLGLTVFQVAPGAF